MKPILYSHDEMFFDNNGIGTLVDAVSCIVTEELNGIYELSMKYPISGQLFSSIKPRSIILAKPNKEDDPQPFRVYRITKPLNGTVTIYAEHISYDLAGIPVSTFTANSAYEALELIKKNSEIDNPFMFYTNKGTTAKMTLTTPRSAKSCLFGESGSLLDTYSGGGTGEFHFDKYTVNFLEHRGQNNGVKIVYGKNLTDLKQDANIASAYTGIYPYAVDMDGKLYILPEKILRAEGEFEFERINSVDLSEKFMSDDGTIEEITVDGLRAAAESYMKTHDFGIPKVSIKVSFAQLADTIEYKDIAILETVALGDIVTVEFAKLGVSETSKCRKTVFDSLTEKYDSVTIGSINKNISDSVAESPTKEFVERENAKARVDLSEAIKKATDLLNGANGGVFEILDENNDGINDAWVIKSYDDQKFIKATVNGIGLTTDGGASYRTAITADGINADAITVGTLDAEKVNVVNLDASNITTGTLSADFISGGTIDANDVNIVNLSAENIDTKNIKVDAANITGKLDASQINADGISASNVSLSGKITATSGELENMTITGKLYFGGNSSYYIDANKDDKSYYINLPGLKIDDSSGAVFSGELSAASGSFSGNVTATGGTIGGCSIRNGKLEVPAANITGTLSASQINVDGLSASNVELSGAFRSNSINGTAYLENGYLQLEQTISGVTTTRIVSSVWDALNNGTIGMFLGVSNNRTNLNMGQLYAGSDGTATVGITFTSTQATLFGSWLGTSSAAITSDVNKKHEIQHISEKYETFFDGLTPRLYKYNDGTSDRLHAGFIAQEVLESLEKSDLSTQEFAGYVEAETFNEEKETLETSCFLRYEEFIALNTSEIQKLKARVKMLEAQIAGG